MGVLAARCPSFAADTVYLERFFAYPELLAPLDELAHCGRRFYMMLLEFILASIFVNSTDSLPWM